MQLFCWFFSISFPDLYSLLRMRDEKIELWKNPILEAKIRLLHHMRSRNVLIKIFNLIGRYVANMKLKIELLWELFFKDCVAHRIGIKIRILFLSLYYWKVLLMALKYSKWFWLEFSDRELKIILVSGQWFPVWMLK